jgi:hypothetical protein
MNQLLEQGYLCALSPDEEYARRIDEVNSQFDPLFGIRMPSPNDEKIPLTIMEEALRATGYVWPSTPPAPQPKHMPQPQPRVVATTPADYSAGALFRPYVLSVPGMAEAVTTPTPAPTRPESTPPSDFSRDLGTLQRVLDGLRNLDTAPHPTPATKTTAAHGPRPKTSGEAMLADPEMDVKFAAFMQGYESPQAGRRIEPDQHRKERSSRLRRIGTRIGALCLTAAVAIPLVEFFSSRGAH